MTFFWTKQYKAMYLRLLKDCNKRCTGSQNKIAASMQVGQTQAGFHLMKRMRFTVQQTMHCITWGSI